MDLSKVKEEMMLTFGSLFSGIGGFDLGFEKAGMKSKWQVEIDDYANKVLEKHWPKVHRERDIRKCGRHNLEKVDVICGGFPCQDISYAGRGAGLDGERSGLFFEAIRVVRELRPRIVVLENVAALLTRGLDRVLGTLAEIGFDAEWHCISAAAVGAPHIRDRVFVLGWDTYSKHDNSISKRDQQNSITSRVSSRSDKRKSQNASDSNGKRSQGQRPITSRVSSQFKNTCNSSWWSVEPDVCRVSDEFSEGLDETGRLDTDQPHDIMGLGESHKWNQSDADAEKTRPSQVLPIMRAATTPKAVQGTVGGLDSISSPEVLQPEMYGGGDDARRASDGSTAETGGQVQGEPLRTLRDSGRFTHSPHGYEPGEQRAIEPENALRIMSHVMALDARQPQEFRGEAAATMQRLRQGICEAKTGIVPETLSAVQETWRSAFDKEKEWFILRVSSGNPWCSEWPGVPRVATGVPARVDRLRGLGNAVVPQVAEWIGRKIVESERGN